MALILVDDRRIGGGVMKTSQGTEWRKEGIESNRRRMKQTQSIINNNQQQSIIIIKKRRQKSTSKMQQHGALLMAHDYCSRHSLTWSTLSDERTRRTKVSCEIWVGSTSKRVVSVVVAVVVIRRRSRGIDSSSNNNKDNNYNNYDICYTITASSNPQKKNDGGYWLGRGWICCS